MDDPVRRRSFVRLATAETIQTAGRLVGMTSLAGNLLADGLANLAGAGTGDADGTEGTLPPASTPPASTPSTSPTSRTPPDRPTPPTSPRAPDRPTPPDRPRLDASTSALLTSAPKILLAVNRPQAGPLVLPFAIGYSDGVVSIATRASSAVAAAVRAAPSVTLLLDDADAEQRVMIFGTAQVLEGPTLAGSDPEQARVEITPSHAVRTPR